MNVLFNEFHFNVWLLETDPTTLRSAAYQFSVHTLPDRADIMPSVGQAKRIRVDCELRSHFHVFYDTLCRDCSHGCQKAGEIRLWVSSLRLHRYEFAIILLPSL